MRRRLGRHALGALAAPAAVAAVAGGVVLVGSAVPAYAEIVGDDCAASSTLSQPPEKAPEEPSLPIEQLQIGEAQKIAQRLSGKKPGAGVRIAVIDSGVYSPDVNVEPERFLTPPTLSAGRDATYYHGTAMGGVIAGKARPDVGIVGIAPASSIYDIRVYDTQDAQDGLRQLDEASVIAGLEEAAKQAGTRPGDIRIVNLSLAVEDGSPELLAAVRRVTSEGAIVVTSTGNRETSGEDDEGSSDYEYGEDSADTWFPAGYAKDDVNPLVVAVGTTTAPDEGDVPRGLLSSAIDVVAPTYGAVSYTFKDSTCVFYGSSTSIAAAEVSGILALMMNVFPDATPRELIARLEATATGGAAERTGSPDKYAGHGIVQPIEALTRPLPASLTGGSDGGTAAEQRVPPAALPQVEPDVLRGTRRNAVWWGLIGGGALVVALLLRPVLSRRRR